VRVERRELVDIAIAVGRQILDVYRSGRFDTERKPDGSLVTRADHLADAAIRRALAARWDIPVLSEESAQAAYDERRRWSRLFIVDPLDGTRELVRRTGDFSVAIALVEDGRPVLGVISAPFLGVTWSARRGEGAYRRTAAGERRIANAREGDAPYVALVSRFHGGERLRDYLARRGIQRVLRAGSAIKFGRMAEGIGDLYPRYGRTMEWDVAAGDCIATEAGCRVIAADTGRRLVYNKADLANPGFLVESPRMPPAHP
jgi:3'(2'), 5'-bisphosphate nucleotidase